MRVLWKNFTKSLILIMPLIIMAIVPILALGMWQGEEILNNVWSLRSAAYLQFIVFPYLFCMFSSAARLVLYARAGLQYSPGLLSWMDGHRLLISSVIGFGTALLALLPLCTFKVTHGFSLSFNGGFVDRWFYWTGVFILLIIGSGLIVQWRVSLSPTHWIIRCIFNAKVIYFVFAFTTYMEFVYFQHLSMADREHRHAAQMEGLAFLGVLIAVASILPKIKLKSANQGGQSAQINPTIGSLLSEWRSIVLAVLILLLFAWFPLQSGLLLGSLLVLIAGIGAWVVLAALVWSWLLFVPRRIIRFVLLALVGIGIGLATYTTRMLVADQVNKVVHGAAQGSGVPEDQRISIADDYAAWNGESSNSSLPTIIILAEGGGIRGAYWTVSGLQDFSSPFIDLMSRTYAIIGVSGGALGSTTFMANYLASRRAYQADPSAFKAPMNPSNFAGGVSRRELLSDFIAPWLARMLSTGIPQKFIPVLLFSSKGQTLQDAWYNALTCHDDASNRGSISAASCQDVGQILKAPMAQFPKDVDGRHLPRLIFVATHVGSGKRLLFSSVSFQKSDFPDALLMETLAPRSVTLLSATHTSARFPFVSPPGELVDADGKVAGRVVDGGVHDVSGAQTALDLVRSISRGNKKDFHPIIVDLDNDPEDSAPAEDQSSNMQGIGELQTIISAISHSHNDQSALAKHELLALVCDLKGGYLSLKVDKEKAGPIGLGWTLSQSTGNVLTRAMMQDDAFLVSDHANGTTPASAMAQLVDGAKRSCEDGESRR